MCLEFCVVKVRAQESSQIIKFDTVHLKLGQILTINNRSFISHKDTILYIPQNVPYKISKKKDTGFFEKLDSTAQYNRLTRELRNMILVKRKPHVTVEAQSAVQSESNFVAYRNKIIRNITFKQLDVFGPTIDDTTRTADTWIEKTGNRFHINTKYYLLKNNLIIKPGEPLDPLKLADNERLLREASYIHDAKFFVQEINPENDSVDIYIVIKDVWSKAFNIRADNLYGGRLEFWDRNIFGFGHEIQNNLYWNSRENQMLGYEGLYSIPNIGGSFIRGRAQYLTKFGTQVYGIAFDRNFFAPSTKYAGGISFYKTAKPGVFEYSDTTIVLPTGYNKSDVWLGRSFVLNPSNQGFQFRKNITLTLRVTNTTMLRRPIVSENQFYNYQNRTLYLSSITFTKQKYLKSNLIYNYGRAEDIPYGMELQLTTGYEINEYKNRSFVGVNLAKATYNTDLGYFYFNVGHEGFISGKKIEQGAINGKFSYFTPLFKYKKFKFRDFFDINYTKGINRYKDEYLTLNEEYGLTGFINDSLKGNERLNLNFETVCFSPWYFYEFRFVFFAAAEVSLFGKNKDLWTNPVYSGLSLGIRIRNERLVFNTLELRFHIYPNKPPYSNTHILSLSGEQLLSPETFNTKPPAVSNFR